ncbi:S41 family peptidase [Glaciecola sp. KUL10]|uniref:S41 family peptidase n=1 Tax=Glaciecola sp. (strain KUL10) TaxID=2161813 RepID=UPI000D785663|nr:S41 family peptidase [Glaciecola sp. KUL10]
MNLLFQTTFLRPFLHILKILTYGFSIVCLSLLLLNLLSNQVLAKPTVNQLTSSSVLSYEDKSTLIQQTFEVMQAHYIAPSKVKSTYDIISEKHTRNAYKHVTSLAEFAEHIGRDIRDITQDLHLSIMLQQPDKPLTHILKPKPGKLKYNYAFEQAKYLSGNIAYLKFNKFDPAPEAKSTADSAMLFLQYADAMVIDLRDTVGGSPDLVEYLLSYFIEAETPLWSIQWRTEQMAKENSPLFESEQIETSSTPKHANFRQDFPVWILTSKTSASATELFAGVLKAQNKATVVGETTAGAGYYVGVRPITEHLTFRISLAKPIIAVSNKNWERIGITPDVETHRVDALDRALMLAKQAHPQSVN